MPSTWLPLDLVELGDLLAVMARSDLAAVNPTSLRMASPQLSSATIYTTLLSEIRGNTKPVMYHEACGAWLGGKEGSRSHEAVEFNNQWNMMANFIVMGSFLQVEVLENGMVLPKPRLVSSKYCSTCDGFHSEFMEDLGASDKLHLSWTILTTRIFTPL